MSDRINDSLDAAIDRVATHLVSVSEDAAAVRRIVVSLPARHEQRWWTFTRWPLQTAALGLLVLALAYLRGSENGEYTRDRAEPVAVLDVRPMSEVAELPPPARRVETARTTSAFPVVVTASGNANAALWSGQFSELPPILVPDSLSLPSLQTTTPLATIEPAIVTPIALTELPLTAEALPPSSKE